MLPLKKLLRNNILDMTPYSSARDEYQGENAIFIDANENPYQNGMNRYPDPFQHELKQNISSLKNVPSSSIFLGNGSDEAIDLLIRAFCEPNKENIVAMHPSYGMYKVCASINAIEYRISLLTENFQLNLEDLFQKIDNYTKLIFLCSPNNPTANNLNKEDILEVCEKFNGLVVLDEAYIDFSSQESLLGYLADIPNLVVLQTLSKAWGMAGIRLGMAMAHKSIIDVLNKIKYPYNVNILTQNTAIEQLKKHEEVKEKIQNIIANRKKLHDKLMELDIVEKILPSETNFLMVKVKRAKELFEHLMGQKIIVRDRTKVDLCEGCLRITIGTVEENMALLQSISVFNTN